jgi:hypothetical protein
MRDSMRKFTETSLSEIVNKLISYLTQNMEGLGSFVRTFLTELLVANELSLLFEFVLF